MNCRICGKEFALNKYRPHQKVCSQPVCQYERQLENMKAWRRKNPEYFKSGPLFDGKSKAWRLEHPEYMKEYRAAHKKHHREYMKIYMRGYRKRKERELYEFAAKSR